jgi:hypothetical protein
MKITALAAAAVCALAAAPASAAIMQATYTGVIYGGVDLEGVFADPGTDLSGAAFEYNFVYDTHIGSILSVLGGQSLLAGSSEPLLSATLTILGHTSSPSGLNGYYSMAASVVPDFGDPTYPYTGEFCNYAGAVSGSWFAVCLATDDPLPADLETPFTATAASFAGFADGAFPSPGAPFDQFLLTGTPGRLVVTKLRDSPLSPAPEPQAWALMILGLGAAGATLRSRRRTAFP